MKYDVLSARVRVLGLMLAAFLFTESAVHANQYSATYNTTGALAAQITFTGGPNKLVTEAVYVVPFTVTPASGTPFTALCIDLWHAAVKGATFQATPVTPAAGAGGFGAVVPTYATSSIADPALTNAVNYLGTIFSQISTTDANYKEEIGAIQLAIWHLIDGSFKFNAVDTTLTADYHAIVGTFNAKTNSYAGGLLEGGTANTTLIAGKSIAAYDSTKTYTGGTVLLVDQSKGADQDLITWQTPSGSTTVTGIAPEPSTLAIAGVGAVMFAGYALRRRRALRV